MKPNEHDIIGTRPRRNEVAGLPMFEAITPAEAEREISDHFLAPPPKPPRRTARAAEEPNGEHHPFLSRRDADRLEGIETVKAKVREPLVARALLRVNRFEAPGVTADDVVELARELPQAALLGQQQRAWSWVGPWLASLAKAGELAELIIGGQVVYRRSRRPEAHGNLQLVYVHPTDERAAARGAA